MICLFGPGVCCAILAGPALHAAGAPAGRRAGARFGRMPGLTRNRRRMHALHRPGTWRPGIFIVIHTQVAIGGDTRSRQSIVSTMRAGHRSFRDGRP
jgi:Ni,Fe-hydrogenase I cytochrome b subunit